MTTTLTLLFLATAVHAQGCYPSPSFADYLARGLAFLTTPVESDVPGATNPYSFLLFPPYFSGEVRLTPVYMNLIKGEIEFNNTAIDLESSDGISLSSKGGYVEFMTRLQVSRFSFRAHYYADIRRIPASRGYVNWLNWRIGADADVICTQGIRIGPTLDLNLERPSLSFNGLAHNPGNSGKVDGYLPLTLGFFASYNPRFSWVVSPTAEFRARWPFPFRSGENLRTQMAQVTEWEYAIGLKLPPTRATGSVGLRFGNRDTTMKFGGTNETHTNFPVSLHWSGQFIELVWFY